MKNQMLKITTFFASLLTINVALADENHILKVNEPYTVSLENTSESVALEILTTSLNSDTTGHFLVVYAGDAAIGTPFASFSFYKENLGSENVFATSKPDAANLSNPLKLTFLLLPSTNDAANTAKVQLNKVLLIK